MKPAKKAQYKEGDVVLYQEKAYFFDSYIDAKTATIYLIDDDETNLLEGTGPIVGYEVPVAEIKKHPSW